jgi:hypothetical protein
MNPDAMTALLIGLSGPFAWSAICRLQLVTLEPRVSMADTAVATRIRNALSRAFGQEKIPAHRAARMAGVLISMVVAVLLLDSALLLARSADPGFDVWGLLALDNPFGGAFNAVKDMLAALVVASSSVIVCHRVRDRKRRPSADDLLMVCIITLLLAAMLCDGARIAFEHRLEGDEPLRWSPIEPVGSAWAFGLAALHLSDAGLFRVLQVGLWGHLSSALISLNLLPNSKNFAIITAALGTFASSTQLSFTESIALDAAPRRATE